MTHDELVANINSPQFRSSRTLETPYDALREVSELHKPYLNYLGQECFCTHCGDVGAYPCPTKKAIEKELGL